MSILQNYRTSNLSTEPNSKEKLALSFSAGSYTIAEEKAVGTVSISSVRLFWNDWGRDNEKKYSDDKVFKIKICQCKHVAL